MTDDETSALLAALAAPQPAVRPDAAHALGELRDPATTLPLAALLQDDDVAVRYATIAALGRLGDPRALGPLLATLRILVAPVDLLADDLHFEQHVGLTLARLGPSVVPALLAVAEDGTEHRGVRYWAVEALGHLGDHAAADTLVRLAASDDETLATGAIFAMAGIADPRFRAPLLAALAAGNDPTRRGLAVQGLIRQGAPDLGDLLLDLLADEDTGVRGNAAYGLGAHGDARALPALVQLRERDAANWREIDGAIAQLRNRPR